MKAAFAMRHTRHIHMIGIGGAGMSGIAEVLHHKGFIVSGSDVAQSDVTSRLIKLGVKVFIGHDAKNMTNTDVVVRSTAIKDNNVEVITAKGQNIPVISRAAMLAELMRFSFGIAVAGTHGKTTTTSIISHIFAHAGEDPTFIIGGKLKSHDAHGKLGSNDYMIAEADESDKSFLYLNPMISVVTNVDIDHMGAYQGDPEVLYQSFLDFVHRLPFYGLAVVCLDDFNIKKLLPKIERPRVTYGFDAEADYFIGDVKQSLGQVKFKVTNQKGAFYLNGQAINDRNERGSCSVNNIPNLNKHASNLDGLMSERSVGDFNAGVDVNTVWECEITLPGRHNILNAVAALVVANEQGIEKQKILEGLASFEGIDRRFDVSEAAIDGKQVTVIDDYGHHPKELDAMINTVREMWPNRRLVMAFQPHRYSRTRDLFDDFCVELSKVDLLLLMDVYSAGERFISGADGKSLSQGIRQLGMISPVFIEKVSDAPDVLERVIQEGDILLVQGAGDIGKLPQLVKNNCLENAL